MAITSHLRSSKLLGKYERPLIMKTAKYLQQRGFQVVPHTRFNIAMSNVLSDIDILATKDGHVYVIEVKSRRDKLRRAIQQLDKVKDFVDYIYVATDKRVKKWNYRKIGLLFIDSMSNTIHELHKAKLNRTSPRLSIVSTFQKKCLLRTSRVIRDKPTNRSLYKGQVAEIVMQNSTPRKLRLYMKQIATCDLDCKNNCPIWGFTSRIKNLHPNSFCHN